MAARFSKKRSAKQSRPKTFSPNSKLLGKRSAVSNNDEDVPAVVHKKKRVSWAEKLEHFQNESVSASEVETIDSKVDTHPSTLTPRKSAIKTPQKSTAVETAVSNSAKDLVKPKLNKAKTLKLTKIKKPKQKAEVVVNNATNETPAELSSESKNDFPIDTLEDAKLSDEFSTDEEAVEVNNAGNLEVAVSASSKDELVETTKAKYTKFDFKTAMERTVFVGNVSYDIKAKMLKKLFTPYGKIQAIYKRSSLQKTEKLTKKMFGTDKDLKHTVTDAFVYVRFFSEESAKKSTELNGTLFNGRNLRVKLSSDKSTDPNRSLFVGNLPYNVSEQTLMDLFTARVGEVELVRIVHDKTTGLGKGYGFVTFKHSEQIAKALELLKGHRFKGRQLRLMKMISKKNKNRLIAASNYQAQQSKKENESRSLKHKLANYTVTKKTFANIDLNCTSRLSKTAIKSIKKRKQLKSKKHSLFS